MNTFRMFALVAVLMATPGLATAQMDMKPYQGSPEFERLKTLVGVWEGEMPMKGKEGMPQGNMKMRVSYHLTAGGSVVVETFAPGTPMEMVSMYHDRGGKLSMTHYCMLGNQPRMDLQSAGAAELKFKLSEDKGVDAVKGMCMQSMDLTVVDAYTIVQRWTMFQDGVAQPAHDMRLTRVE